MIVYYNEHDAYPAAWLRNLGAAGHIPAGLVDERSIADVRAGDLVGATVAHFFAGIGGWAYALRLAGWPDDRSVWTGSCPCQPFSAAGKRGGFADARHLWPEWFRLIRECGPATIFGEQVANPDGLRWFDAVSADLEREGYAVGAADLCAASVGAPHLRQRLFFVADSNEGRCGTAGRRRDGGALGERRVDTVHGSAIADAGEARAVAHAEGDRASRDLRHGEGEAGQAACDYGGGRTALVGMLGSIGGGTPHIIAEAERGGRESGRVRSSASPAKQSVAVRQLGNPVGAGLARREDEPGDDGAERTAAERAGGDAGGVVLSDGRGSPARNGTAAGDGHGSPALAAGGGPWSACDWLPCRDGKARPIEPGTFPLAHGVSARVGRLRAYGNAVVPQVAAAFVMAYLETTP